MEKKLTTMHEKDLQRTSVAARVGGLLVKFGVYAFLIVMALIVLFPFYWMIISSLKSEVEYRQTVPTFWPQQFMPGNYVEAFTTANLGDLFGHTVFVGVVSTVLSLVITVLSAFAMWLLRRCTLKGLPLAGLLMPALFNAILVGWELSVYIGGGFFLNGLYVAIGELIVLFTAGTVLYTALRRRRLDRTIFGG